jgi:hypothetical protein
VPEGGFAGGKQCVLAGVPAEKVGRASVRGVVLAGSPDFMEKESAGLVDRTMKIEAQAASFLARGRDQRAKLGFQEHVLAFLGAESDDEGDCVFGQFCDRGALGAAPGRLAGFLFRHVGGDCTPNSLNGKENRERAGHDRVGAATSGRGLCGRR